jgi:putative glutamine amidotransferase
MTSTAPRPLVGLTTTIAPVYETSAGAAVGPAIEAAFVDAAYLGAVRGAGLLPVLLPPNDPADADAALDGLAALVLTGGEDVEPARYETASHPAAGPYVPARDAWELALVQAARERRLPTLAICRGVQVLNVALGGTLLQHLADGDDVRGARHDRPRHRASRVHAIVVAPESPLARALGVTSLAVNSYHHQAVEEVAHDLAAAGWCEDGVIEALVARDERWPLLGVQWHPEDLVGDAEPWDRQLFAWLAREARHAAARHHAAHHHAPPTP